MGGARATLRRQRGLTLLEVLVAIAIVAFIGVLIYGAFHGMTRSRTDMNHFNDRFHQGRTALARMAREVSCAFLSAHTQFGVEPGSTEMARMTAFIGTNDSTADRVDFTSFSHRRLRADVHESDQNELSYFASRDPDSDNLDLVRRESKYIDSDPSRGGIIQVLAEDIESFDVRYLDPLTGEWVETWDSTQPAAQLGRMPSQVWLTLALRGGPGGQPAVFQTKVPIGISMPLNFATGR